MGTNRSVGTVKACESCGRDFHPLRTRGKSQRFCSIDCRDTARRKPVRAMSETETAWLAGLFDGEGYIGIGVQLSQRARGVKIQITNTHRPLLEEVQRVTGIGRIGSRYRHSERHRETYDWVTSGGNAKLILSRIEPFLIAKKDRAREAMADGPQVI